MGAQRPALTHSVTVTKSTLPAVLKLALFLKLSADVRLEENSVPQVTRALRKLVLRVSWSFLYLFWIITYRLCLMEIYFICIQGLFYSSSNSRYLLYDGIGPLLLFGFGFLFVFVLCVCCFFPNLSFQLIQNFAVPSLPQPPCATKFVAH